MKTGDFLGRRSLRLFAIPLIIVAVATLLIELDMLVWRHAWIVPPIIALYVGIEILALSVGRKGKSGKSSSQDVLEKRGKP